MELCLPMANSYAARHKIESLSGATVNTLQVCPYIGAYAAHTLHIPTLKLH